MFRTIAFAALLLNVPPGVYGQEPMTLAEAYHLAEQNNPTLRAALARVDAATAASRSATLPPDPAFEVGIMNASLPSLGTDMPGAMLPFIQLMQMFPVGGKLRLTGDMARQETALRAAEAAEVFWELRAQTAMAWHEIYAADRQLAVMQETLDWLRQFEEVATTMYSVGTGRQSDVLRAGVEVARMRADIARMRSMRVSAVARLNALLARPTDADVRVTSMEVVPHALPAVAVLKQWADDMRPMLERGRIAVDQARTRETLARREIWPDLSLGVQYGQRRSGMRTERMGSLMVGFTIPVFAGRRQLPMREEAAAMRNMATAELANVRTQVESRIHELLAELERGSTLLVLYRTEVLPQAEANAASAFASYRVGRVDFMTLVDAQMSLNRYALELHALEADFGTRVAELEMTVGRRIPAMTTASKEGA